MIGEDIYIIDDVIPLSKQTEIEDLFTHSRIPWIFNRDISLTQQEIKKLGIKKSCLVKSPINPDDRYA